LKRVGERGGGNWQRITWDEALDTIARKLLEIKDKYGSQSVMVKAYGSSSVGLLMGRHLGQRFANVWGASRFESKSEMLADTMVTSANLLTLGDSTQSHSIKDCIHSKMIIIWGGNPAETYIPDMKYILDARDGGAKLVVIGPVFNATAAKADQWIPVRPGTDGALALAMMNVIIEEELYDKDYVAKYTVAPFLVRGDNKLLMRDANKCLVWDERADTPMPHDQATRPRLLGSLRVSGVVCKTAFQLLAETAAQYRPEKAAEITGIPAEAIRKLAVEYASSKPVAIKIMNGGVRTFNGTLSCQAIITLAAITGNIGIPGGGSSITFSTILGPIVLNDKAVVCPPGAPGLQVIPGTKSPIRGWAAIREGKPHPVKALITAYRNHLQTYGHIEGYREIFSQLDLIVVADILMTRTAQYADIVLPEATIFERDDIEISGDYLLRMEKAIEPLYETKPALEIWSELARRVGLGEYFEYSAQDYIKMLLDSGHPSVAGITLERLDKEKLVRGNIPVTPPVPFVDKKFPTPSGKIEFYKEHLIGLGQELPIYQETSERQAHLDQKYPLTFLTVHERTFTQTLMHNVDWMRQITPEPVLDMNPVDAQGRGIKNGDMVEVFNDRGNVKLKARLSEAVMPGVVKTIHGWWPEQYAEGHYSDLLHRVDDLSIINPALEMEPITSNPITTSCLIHYDCLVEVRKVRGEEHG